MQWVMCEWELVIEMSANPTKHRTLTPLQMLCEEQHSVKKARGYVKVGIQG